ncbi:galectin-3-like isoform X1 [Pleurodeles waltl]
MLAFITICLLLLNLGSTAANFHMDFKGGLKPNTLLTMFIDIPENTPRFGIDLKQDEANIVFQFDPRFDYNKKLYTICNSMENNNWGHEIEYVDDFPFKTGKKYQIDIVCQPDSYEVYVDGNYYLKFKSPMKPVDRVKYMEIWGAQTDYAQIRTI